MRRFLRNLRRRSRHAEIAPDEIFADSSNIPQFDRDQFEGRIERPLRRRTLAFLGAFFGILFLAYALQSANLELLNGKAYAERAEKNQLAQVTLFADRGEIYDRMGRPLATNERPEGSEYSTRVYAPWRGIANVLGYAKPPAKDQSGAYFRETSVGLSGFEQAYDSELAGQNGSKLTETDAHGAVVSESTVVEPQNGEKMTLSIDAAVSQALYDAIKGRADSSKFQGGAGVLMDVHTGEIVALVSYPEYPLQTMADGTDTPAISALLSDKKMPFLDRAIDGLYTPGSIVKPYMATAALTEGVITPSTTIYSSGSISVPNPYNPAHPSIFKDWRANGLMDVQHGIAYSSDVFFYEIGGGFQSQKGIGIDNIDKYLRLFGFGAPTGLTGFTESNGTIPTPAWKAQVFPSDPTWRLGDTYHTVIGQYGVQVTPLQAARALSAMANGGTLLTPTLIASSTPQGVQLPIDPKTLEIVRGGMRLGVEIGTATAINVPFVDAAAKTGTAQLGNHNEYMNSWITTFFPYEHPRYALAIVLEKAPAGTLVGAPAAAYDFLSWLNQNAPEYLK